MRFSKSNFGADFGADGSIDIRKIEEENLRLEKELSELGAYGGKFSDDISPVEYNQFLKQVWAMHYEEQVGIKTNKGIKTLFPDETFPKSEEMDEEELGKKLDSIIDILENNNILVEISDSVPDKLLYEYLVKEIEKNEIEVPSKSNMFEHLNGCSGYCEGCFQKDYCDIYQDEYGKEM